MPARAHKFQPPKGTRDFYPDEMALRRHLESVWRDVSINHGFDEVEGPTFEHLELYTVKSGEGIVSGLFSFRRAGGDADYALRPEFTPTLARMVAARAAQLPKPIRWFSIPSHYRAERPQRGRLREFVQWNVDVLGDESPAADAEIIAVTVGVLEKLGLTPKDVEIRLSDRVRAGEMLRQAGVEEEDLATAFGLLDRQDRVSAAEFAKGAETIHLDLSTWQSLCETESQAASRFPVFSELNELGIAEWARVDLSIVRGLAYYTGTVFEVHEVSGKERAIAGGGRYDNLVELFGGPPTPAVGIAMGDVVIRLVLEDLGRLEPAERYLPRPDVFVISAGTDKADAALRPLVARLRRAGLHVRYSSRSTRNVGKLLGEAGKARARQAVILGEELEAGRVLIKDLDSGEQRDVPIYDLADALRDD